MSGRAVIPDSSFYICFLGDIEKPEILIRMLELETLGFATGPIIRNEITSRGDYERVSDVFDRRVETLGYYHYGEIVRPMFSLTQMEKGEHEVFVISYIFQSQGRTFTAILDDEGARKFLERGFPELFECVRGTIGFLKVCTMNEELFGREECVEILKLIRKSKFRVKRVIIDEAIAELREG